MGCIYKRGRVWYVDVRANGMRIRERIETSKKIATLALKDAEVRVARSEFGFAQTDIAVSKFPDRFLDYSGANHQKATTDRYPARMISAQAAWLQSSLRSAGSG